MNNWERFRTYYTEYPELGLALDLSKVNWPDGIFDRMQPKISAALHEMEELERGAIANPDENRMVGHYWLRNPDLAPDQGIRSAIVSTVERIKAFAAKVHFGEVQGEAGRFEHVIVIGIGGSALGPLFVSNALATPADKLSFHILDNTDPDGIDRVLTRLQRSLGTTLCIVISKSGGTKETRNGMLEVKAAYDKVGLSFGKHAVAVTQQGSQLDDYAVQNGWIDRFPMWDWVGGRTSELSAVGLLPAALQGFDIVKLLNGARDCDCVTRQSDVKLNPALRMALAWYAEGNGKGDRNLVFLPYKDRLELLSKYLQQLIMESIGKEHDRSGRLVNQGFNVFGNKGSTDQHSFVQQLRDGRDDFLVTFIEVLRDRDGDSLEVEPGLTSGDYLQGFLLGTRAALSERFRPSITITVRDIGPSTIGALIALFERSVGYYASLININAYHQPGVEAGKKAAGEIVMARQSVLHFLRQRKGVWFSTDAIAVGMETNSQLETIFKLCSRMAANPQYRVERRSTQRSPLAEFRAL